MLWVVAPVLQRYPDAGEEVRITLPLGQNVSGPLAEMVGLDAALTWTTVAEEVPVQLPVLLTV